MLFAKIFATVMLFGSLVAFSGLLFDSNEKISSRIFKCGVTIATVSYIAAVASCIWLL